MHRWIGFLAFLVSLGSLCAFGEEPPRAVASDSPLIVGYLPGYRIETIDPAIGKLATDVIFFSLEPTAEGGLAPDRLSEKQRGVLEEIRKHGARLHFSLGGWGRSAGFAAIAADDKRCEKFVSAVSQFAEAGGFAGVDVDWEFPQGEKQVADFAKLVHKLKASLSASQRTLSVAVACSQPLPPALVADVDRIHLMAYDAGERHSTFELAATEVEKALARGIPASKLCLGVPFYGRMTNGPSKSKSYAELVRDHHPAPEVDEVDHCYFNGIGTIKRKSQLALDRKLAGIMIWELGQDSTDETSLLRAVDFVLNRRK